MRCRFPSDASSGQLFCSPAPCSVKGIDRILTVNSLTLARMSADPVMSPITNTPSST